MGQLPGVAQSALGQELTDGQRRLGDERPTERWAALGHVRAQLPSWKGRANEEVAREVRARLAAASPAPFAMLATSPMLKWRPEELPAGEPVQALELHAARGEAESAQWLLTPLRGTLADCRVTVEWDHPGIELELSWVDYVSVTTPTGAGFNLPGRYPDILRPLPPAFGVAAGQAQALWCTAWVGREAQPGQYHGRVRIAAGGDEQAIAITVQVHHAVLPERPALSTIVTSEPWQGIPYYGKENYAAVAERMARHCLRYRLTPGKSIGPGLGTGLSAPPSGVLAVAATCTGKLTNGTCRSPRKRRRMIPSSNPMCSAGAMGMASSSTRIPRASFLRHRRSAWN
jgi:hypothetical protein